MDRFADLSSVGVPDIWNPMSVWAAKQAHSEARRQGAVLVNIVRNGIQVAGADVRVWDPTPKMVPGTRLNLRG